jgi:hypothetical protein
MVHVLICISDTMNNIKKKLINKAIQKYRKIFPCGNQKDISDCFTQIGNDILFWFNTEDESTHLLKECIHPER